MENQKRMIDANEALRMMRDSKTDNPFLKTIAEGVWGMAHDCGISCVEACPTINAVEVPCKMGDVVWGLKICHRRKIPTKGLVYQMFFGEDMRLCICVKNVCRGEWGKNVFATEAEALAAIGERRTDNG